MFKVTMRLAESLFKCLLLFVICVALKVYAEGEDKETSDDSEPEVAEQQAIYLPLKPPFIVNYGGAGRLRYLKVDISVRLANIDAANAVRYHLPFVRNNLIMLLASQTNETVSSQEGKEKMRLDALEALRDVVERENQTPRDDIVDLYFNNFIVHK